MNESRSMTTSSRPHPRHAIRKRLPRLVFGCTAALLCAGSVLLCPGKEQGGDNERILWHEDFRGVPLGPGPALYHDGKGEILEEDGRRFYRFPGGFMGGFDYFGAQHWRDYEMRFKLRPQGHFSLWAVAKARGWRTDTDYLWYYVQISNRHIRPYAHGLPAGTEPPDAPATPIDPPLASNVWYDVTIRCQDGDRLYVEVAGKNRAPVTWDHKVLPGGGGANLHGNGVFDLANIVVEECPTGL